MSGLGADLDAIAAAGGYDDTDAVVEEAVRELLRRRPELRLSLAVEKYRTGAVSLNRGAELPASRPSPSNANSRIGGSTGRPDS